MVAGRRIPHRRVAELDYYEGAVSEEESIWVFRYLGTHKDGGLTMSMM